MGFIGGGGLFDVPIFGEALGNLLGKPDTGNIEDLAKQLGNVTEAEQTRRLLLQEPLRQSIFGTSQTPGQLNEFLNTGELPLSLSTPLTAYQESVTAQGQNVREDIVNRIGARGGQLRNQLLNQRLNESGQIAQIPLLEQPIRNALWQQALGTAVGNEFPIVSGFGTAGNLYATGLNIDQAFKDNIAGIVGVGAGIAA